MLFRLSRAFIFLSMFASMLHAGCGSKPVHSAQEFFEYLRSRDYAVTHIFDYSNMPENAMLGRKMGGRMFSAKADGLEFRIIETSGSKSAKRLADLENRGKIPSQKMSVVGVPTSTAYVGANLVLYMDKKYKDDAKAMRLVDDFQKFS